MEPWEIVALVVSAVVIAVVVILMEGPIKSKTRARELADRVVVARGIRAVLQEHEHVEPGGYETYMRSSAGKQMLVDEVALILANNRRKVARGGCLEVAPLVVDRLALIDKGAA